MVVDAPRVCRRITDSKALSDLSGAVGALVTGSGGQKAGQDLRIGAEVLAGLEPAAPPALRARMATAEASLRQLSSPIAPPKVQIEEFVRAFEALGKEVDTTCGLAPS